MLYDLLYCKYSYRKSSQRRRGVTEPPRIHIQETSEETEAGYLSDSSSSSTTSYEDAEEGINLQLTTRKLENSYHL